MDRILFKRINTSYKFRIRDVLNLTILGISLILFFLILNYCRFGFDFTDEGYYMNYIKNPYLYKYTTSQFGYIYHPIYVLLNKDIVLLRQFNIIFTYVLGICLFYNTLKCFYKDYEMKKIDIIALSFGFGFISLTNNVWLLTPNYNSLAFQGILITLIGLIRSLLSEKRRFIYVFLISFGGLITFMAKPTSSMLLAVLVCIFLIANKKMNFKDFYIIFGLSLLMLLIGALIIDGSIYNFFIRLYKAKEIVTYEGSTRNWNYVIRYDRLSLPNTQILYIALLSFLIFLVSLCNQSKKMIISVLSSAICIITIVYSVSVLMNGQDYSSKWYPYLGGYFFSIIIASIIMVIFDYRVNKQKIHFRKLLSIIIVFFMVYVYSFGTNNDYWNHGVRASIFYVLGSAILIMLLDEKKAYYRLVSFFSASCLISTIIISSTIAVPYRQPQNLLIEKYSGNYGELGNTLMLSKEFGKYIKDACNLSQENGFNKDTPIIDLSGQSPGLVYAIGAKSIGNGWLIGGLAQSENISYERLKVVDSILLKEAWLITEPDGPRSINNNLLTRLGLDISNYEVVASWDTPINAGGYKYSRKQYLMKPLK